VTAIRNPADQQVIGFCKILSDRTDLRAQIEALERRIHSLESARDRRYLFLATLVHELRNPLAPIASAVELIQLSEGRAEDLQFPLKILDRQLDLLRRLVEDLHDTIAATSGKMQIASSRLHLQDVLQAAFDACKPMARRRHQQYQTLFLPSPIVVRGDADRLQQVFVNLLTNAIKYTGDEGRILFKATVEGDEAVIRVEDNGMGISAAMLPRIFELFTQEETAARTEVGGPRAGAAAGPRARGAARRDRPGAQRGPRSGQRIHRSSAARDDTSEH
jgi:two-component system CheB/CheR fusion protein